MTMASEKAIEGIATFWRWWTGELVTFVPPSVRKYFQARSGLVTLDLDGDQLIIGHVVSGRYRELARMSQAGPEASGLTTETRQRVATAIQAGAKIALRICQDQVLRKQIDFPLTAERDLRQILNLELDLHTPAVEGAVFFDHRIIERNKKAKLLTVELAVVRRETVAQAMAVITPLGLVPSIIGVPSSDGVQFNFAPQPPKPVRLTRFRIAAAGAAVIALVSPIVAIHFREAERSQKQAELAAEIAKQRSRSEQAAQLRHEFDEASQRYLFLPKRRQSPLAVTTLNELAHLLPDDTWLSQVEITGQQMRVSGFSAAASRLLSLIDQSPLFANAQFRAPLTQVAGRSLERFDLSFDIKQGQGQ